MTQRDPLTAPVPLRVQTLGRFAVWRDGQHIPAAAWQRRKAGILLKALLAAPGHRLGREQASMLLWPESDLEAGRRDLRTSLHQVRRLLDGSDAMGNGPSVIQDEGDAVVLIVRATPGSPALPPEAWLDAAAFRCAATRALAGVNPAACHAALSLYRGDYLPDDLSLDADWPEPWIGRERDALRQLHRRLLRHLAGLHAAEGEWEAAEEPLQTLLRLDPTDDEAAAQLMGLLAGCTPK